MISIVTVLHNSQDALPAYSRAIVSGLDQSNVEVIFVDNGSERGVSEDDFDFQCEVVRQENLGFASGCNQGWRRASGEWVFFVNPDAEVKAGQLVQLARAVGDNDNIAVVAPFISPSDSFSPMMGPPWRRLKYGVGEKLDEGGELIRATSVSGSCFGVRRDVLEVVGGLDERFFMYCEENDLQKRVQDLGYIVAVLKSVEVIHHGSSGSVNISLNRDSERERSKRLFYRKHYSVMEMHLMNMLGGFRSSVRLFKRVVN
jgi:N-acetylglucosaminyl-diphospho-decaprenol L-rhamnosyltransferase